MAPAAEPLVRALDAALPQTQCRRCGYPGCADYAAAMASGEAGPERCPPGGDGVAARLADTLGVAPQPVDRALGEVAPWQRAVIVESGCIGCTRCIAACPVDAIIGGARLMHAVIEHECTGCDLCLPACPVDCIEMVATGRWTPLGALEAWFADGASIARARFDARRGRGDDAGIRRETKLATGVAPTGEPAAAPPSATRPSAPPSATRPSAPPSSAPPPSAPAPSAPAPSAPPPSAPPPSAPRTQHADFVAAALARARAKRAASNGPP